MKRQYFNHFPIAGFTYYEGAFVFQSLKIGAKLKLKPEPENTYDNNAIAIYYKGKKLGFVPRRENKQLSVLLNAGLDVFDVRVQCLFPEEIPENQVQVVVFVKAKQKTTHNDLIVTNEN